MNSDEIMAPYLAKVSEGDQPAVRRTLGDLVQYLGGNLSLHHLGDFCRAIVANDLRYAARKADPTNLKYLGVYGLFVWEQLPPAKIVPLEMK